MRKEKKVIQIKDVLIGGNNSIKLQSMTNTKTSDIDATINQIKELESIGCEIIRVAITSFEDAQAIKEIKKQIKITHQRPPRQRGP